MNRLITKRQGIRLAMVLMIAGLLSGCPFDGDGGSSTAAPANSNFSDFVANLFGANPTTAEPVEINDVDFTGLDDANPNAFDNQLQ